MTTKNDQIVLTMTRINITDNVHDGDGGGCSTSATTQQQLWRRIRCNYKKLLQDNCYNDNDDDDYGSDTNHKTTKTASPRQRKQQKQNCWNTILMSTEYFMVLVS